LPSLLLKLTAAEHENKNTRKILMSTSIRIFQIF